MNDDQTAVHPATNAGNAPKGNPAPPVLSDPVLVIAEKPKAPKPHDPFREFPTDRRRMGP